MHSAEQLQTDAPDTVEPSDQAAKVPLLGDEQIATLQTVLRAMAPQQLQQVLAALDPNVLRLCLHAIYATPVGVDVERVAEPAAEEPEDFEDLEEPAGVARRMSPRAPTQVNAKIHSPADGLTVDCLILDTSSSGALLFLDHSGALPETFELYDVGNLLPGESMAHLPHQTCKQVWRKRNKVGVTFIV